MEPAEIIAALAPATERLITTIESLTEADYSAPTLLPGWTRAHLISHLGRNTEAMRNFVLAARSGQFVGGYSSGEVRSADIAAGATRSPAIIALDAITAGRRLLIEYSTVPDAMWSTMISFASVGLDGPMLPLSTTAFRRLREVEVHHVDLAAGYTFDESPPWLIAEFLDDHAVRLRGANQNIELHADDLGRAWSVGSSGPAVSGRSTELLAWLLGRSAGATLSAPDGLPTLPSVG